MKPWIVLLMAALPALPAAAAPCALTDWLGQRYGISFSGFERPIPAAAKEPAVDAASSVRVLFPDAPLVADGFRHTVVMDVAAGKAWILRTGGFAPVRQWFGPVEVPALSAAGCRIEPALAPPRQVATAQSAP